MIFANICRNLSVKASDFFFNKLCPFSAPFNLIFICVKALDRTKIIKLYILNSAHLIYLLLNTRTYIRDGNTTILSFPDILCNYDF